MQIREALPSDLPAIRGVHLDAFGEEGSTVAELALALIADESAKPLLALVAESDGAVFGCVLFSSVHIQGAEKLSARILAPLAVARSRQRMGVGRQLIERGLAMLRERGTDLVFVLGDPGYYVRHGFSPRHHVRPPHEVPYPEAWMALALRDATLESVNGRLACARSLDHPEHW